MHHGMGKSSRAAIHDYKEIDPYRMSPHAHENHGHPYPGLPSAEIINSPLSAAHYQTPVYHVHPPMHVLRHQEQSWNSNPDNEYASALVGSLKIDDGGVGKLCLSD